MHSSQEIQFQKWSHLMNEECSETDHCRIHSSQFQITMTNMYQLLQTKVLCNTDYMALSTPTKEWAVKAIQHQKTSNSSLNIGCLAISCVKQEHYPVKVCDAAITIIKPFSPKVRRQKHPKTFLLLHVSIFQEFKCSQFLNQTQTHTVTLHHGHWSLQAWQYKHNT